MKEQLLYCMLCFLITILFSPLSSAYIKLVSENGSECLEIYGAQRETSCKHAINASTVIKSFWNDKASFLQCSQSTPGVSNPVILYDDTLDPENGNDRSYGGRYYTFDPSH